jgi:putative transposase
MGQEGKVVSLRKIARWLEVPWSSVQYKPRRRRLPPMDGEVEKEIYNLIQRYPRYGYRRITVMLRRKQALVVNRKKVQRIMKRNGWGVRSLPKGFRPRVPASRSVSAFVSCDCGDGLLEPGDHRIPGEQAARQQGGGGGS